MTDSGAISLTGNSYAVLAVINRLGEGSSYDVKLVLNRCGFWSIPHTTSYEEPLRLAKLGLPSSQQQEGGRRRRVFAITDTGRQALTEWLAQGHSPDPEIRDEGLLRAYAGADVIFSLKASAEWHQNRVADLGTYIERVESGLTLGEAMLDGSS